MRKSLVLAVAVTVGLAIAARPRDAEACGGAPIDGTVVAAALVVAGAYAGTTAGMGIYDLTADDPSRGYGVVEALVHTPITLAWGAAFIDDLRQPDSEWDNDDSEVWLGVMTGLHATLAIHGMYTAGKARKPKAPRTLDGPPRPIYGPPGMVNVGGVSANVTLTPVTDGRSVGGGLGLAGTF